MTEDFSDFEDLNIPAGRYTPLPDQLVLLGADGEEMRALLVDSDERLVIESASPVHYARLPVLVPTGTAGKLEEHPTDGIRTVYEINVVNYPDRGNILTIKQYFIRDQENIQKRGKEVTHGS